MRFRILLIPFLAALVGCNTAPGSIGQPAQQMQARMIELTPALQRKIDAGDYHIKQREADSAAYANLTPRDTMQNRRIDSTLFAERFATVTVSMPTWVKDRFREFETTDEGKDGYAFARSVAWGTGTYNGKPLYWFAHTNSDSWLQVDLSAKLDSTDVRTMTGATFSDGEWVAASNAKVEVRITADSTDRFVRTWIGDARENPTGWTAEFCKLPDSRECDTAGALEKYLLPNINAALPAKLKLELRARIPYGPHSW